MEQTKVRSAVSDATGRVAALIESTAMTDLDRPALGTWTVGDLACHLVHALEFAANQATGAPEPIDDLNLLGDLNRLLVAGETERTPARLAERARAAASRFLEATATLGPSLPRALFGGLSVPVDGLACVMISESLVHGLDLANATGRQWEVLRDAAALAVEGYMFRVLSDPKGVDFVVDWDAAGDLHACFHIKLRTGGQAWFVFDGRGQFRLAHERPAGRRVDCHVLADPAALLLVTWGRRSQWSAIARGQLFAWGPKPWLGLRLTSIFRTP